MRRFSSAIIQKLTQAIFVAAGSEPGEAEIVASHLVEASVVGHDSHGVIRISKYVDWLRDGLVRANRHARIVTDRGALIVVEGDFGFGQVIGREAMDIAARRAASHGMATLAIRNSGHLGRIGAWPEMLTEHGLASIHFVNTSGFGILVAPFGGSDRRLSANPIAAGAPVRGGRPIILDIATSVIAEGKIQVARNKGEQLPPGLVLDGRGQPTTDPEDFYKKPPGAILPFGGHKGSGMSFFCEILAGALTGGARATRGRRPPSSGGLGEAPRGSGRAAPGDRQFDRRVRQSSAHRLATVAVALRLRRLPQSGLPLISFESRWRNPAIRGRETAMAIGSNPLRSTR